MSVQTTPNYTRRAVLLILALGVVGVILALISGSASDFLTFNLTQVLVLGVIFLIGGVLLWLNAGGSFSPGNIASLIIGIGVLGIVLGLVLKIGNITPNLLSFDLMQLVWLGVLFVIVGFMVRSWLESPGRNIARSIAWLLIWMGVIFMLIGAGFQLLNIAADFVTFSLLQLFALGVVFAVVGVLLLIFFAGELEVHTAPMAKARAASVVPPKGVPPPAPPPIKAAVVEAPVVPRAAPAKRDDLLIIEGIGPKSAEALYKAGITTFQQVADMSAAELTRIVKEGGVNLVNDAKTWPEQARLLAEGKTKEFEDYVTRLVNLRDPKDKKS
jgi:predicted flap endonuclease-1-like 5' DNA nuclease